MYAIMDNHHLTSKHKTALHAPYGIAGGGKASDKRHSGPISDKTRHKSLVALVHNVLANHSTVNTTVVSRMVVNIASSGTILKTEQ